MRVPTHAAQRWTPTRARTRNKSIVSHQKAREKLLQISHSTPPSIISTEGQKTTYQCLILRPRNHCLLILLKSAVCCLFLVFSDY
uniref:Uncharacterized protein n=1 Tax=Pararge aegeria TaxID=116150 RepID=S4PZR4_9NEOP